ncbi:hypothetical protein P9112_000109 [Eukaryota sp. TZLM1-RC]
MSREPSSDEFVVNDITSFVGPFERALITHDESVAARAAKTVFAHRKKLSVHLVQRIITSIHTRPTPTIESLTSILDRMSDSSTDLPMSSEELPPVNRRSFTDLLSLLLVSLYCSSNPPPSSILLELVDLIKSSISMYYHVREVIPIIGHLHFSLFRLYSLSGTSFSDIKNSLMVSYRHSVHSQDPFSQAVLINSILYSMLQSIEISQMQKFIDHVNFPLGSFPSQDARYFYYRSFVALATLDYSEALNNSLSALRKAPSKALAFRVNAQKISILSQLSIGETPSRVLFRDPDMKAALYPYLCLVKAVRNGSVEVFKQVVGEYQTRFEKDKVLPLVLRLRSSVVRLGLKNVFMAYNKISITELKTLLGLGDYSNAHIEGIVAKAIRDGVVAGKLNEGYFTREKEYGEGKLDYDTLATRIAFAIALHQDAKKSMRYTAGVEAEELDLEEIEKERKAEQEARKHAEASGGSYSEPSGGGW